MPSRGPSTLLKRKLLREGWRDRLGRLAPRPGGLLSQASQQLPHRTPPSASTSAQSLALCDPPFLPCQQVWTVFFLFKGPFSDSLLIISATGANSPLE